MKQEWYGHLAREFMRQMRVVQNYRVNTKACAVLQAVQ